MHVYHVEKDRAKIERYCAADVVVLTQLYMKMNNCALIEEENIEVTFIDSVHSSIDDGQ